MASLFLRNRHPQRVYFVTESHTTEWEVGDRISSDELKKIIESKGRRFLEIESYIDSSFLVKKS